ncbi:unnamed protein product [Symbiodinium microadriaticum]|nr:unnamed protein product [Symbiodinium microadriaticum]
MAASEEEAGTASSELLAWKELCRAGKERQPRANSDDEETQEQSPKARGASKTLLRLQTASTMINTTDGSSASSSSRSRSVSAAISEDRESSSSWFSRGCTPSICNSDDGRFAHHVVFRRAQTTNCEEALRAARAMEAVRLEDASKLSTGQFERKFGASTGRSILNRQVPSLDTCPTYLPETGGGSEWLSAWSGTGTLRIFTSPWREAIRF